MQIELYKFMSTLEDVPAEHVRHIARRLYVPTEFVIHKPQHLVPDVARIYSTNLWNVNDTIMGYDTLAQEPSFRGTSYYDEILLAEVWLDHGDDGHIQYSLRGWMYITTSRLEEELAEDRMKWQGLPTCMCWGKDYDKHYKEMTC